MIISFILSIAAGVFHFGAVGPSEILGHYDKRTDVLWVSPKASTWVRYHEECHREFFKTLTPYQRYKWYLAYRRWDPYCYTTYAFSFRSDLIGAQECFAELCAHLRGATNPEYGWPLQEWPFSPEVSYQVPFIKGVLNLK